MLHGYGYDTSTGYGIRGSSIGIRGGKDKLGLLKN